MSKSFPVIKSQTAILSPINHLSDSSNTSSFKRLERCIGIPDDYRSSCFYQFGVPSLEIAISFSASMSIIAVLQGTNAELLILLILQLPHADKSTISPFQL